MQLLDVGVFQPYKHWHSKAIQSAIATMDFDYTIASFLRNLDQVRTQTFTKSIIKSAFQKAGIWPPNLEVVIKAMQKYVKEHKEPEEKEPNLELPAISYMPKTLCQVEAKSIELCHKITEALSSPTRSKFESLERGRDQLLYKGKQAKVEAKVLYNKVAAFTNKKPISRKQIQKGGELTGDQAQAIIDKRNRKEAQKQAISKLKALQKVEGDA